MSVTLTWSLRLAIFACRHGIGEEAKMFFRLFLFFSFFFWKKDPLRLHIKVLVLNRFLAGLIKVHFRDSRYWSPWLIKFDITSFSGLLDLLVYVISSYLHYDFSRLRSSLKRPLNFTQNDLCATSDKNTNFNISKTVLCKVGVSNLYAVEQFSSLLSR